MADIESLDERQERLLREGEWRARELAGSGNPMRASFENDAANAWWEKWINRAKAGMGGVAAASLLPQWPVGTLVGAPLTALFAGHSYAQSKNDAEREEMYQKAAQMWANSPLPGLPSEHPGAELPEPKWFDRTRILDAHRQMTPELSYPTPPPAFSRNRLDPGE